MGPNHTACLTDAGKVITFGRNSEAQLGRGHARSVAGPDVVKASSQLSSIKLSWQLQCLSILATFMQIPKTVLEGEQHLD